MYLPFNQRVPNWDYTNALKTILEKGLRTGSATGTGTITYPGVQMRFLVKDGAPLVTMRDLAPPRRKSPTIWQQAIGEILAFINGACTQDEMVKFGCHWWKHWLTEEKCRKRGLETGNLGLGSYGHSFGHYDTSDGPFDQFDGIMLQMKERPELKTHIIDPWQPQFVLRTSKHKQKVVVCPCHGWMHFIVHEKGLTLHMFQRSGDMPVGVPQNMIQYFALLLLVANHIGVPAYEMVHTVSDAHIYENQIDGVRELISRDPKPFPTLEFNPHGNHPRDYRYQDFKLKDYDPDPPIKFAVSV